MTDAFHDRKFERVLVSFDSYFQLIESLLLRLRFFPQARVDFLVGTTSPGMVQLTENLKKLDFVDSSEQCVYIPFKYANIRYKAQVISQMIIPRKSARYDLCLFANYCPSQLTLFWNYLRTNPSCIIAHTDDSFGSYNPPNFSNKWYFKLGEMTNRLLGKPTITESLRAGFFFFPEYNQWLPNDGVIPIEPANEQERASLREYIDVLFDVEAPHVDAPYIFFDQPLIADGYQCDELEYLQQVAQIVGKDNVIVKLHPRSHSNRYSSEGYQVLEQNDLPWEVLMIKSDYTKKMLLTMSSTAVVSGPLLLGMPTSSVMLYKLLDEKLWRGLITPTVQTLFEAIKGKYVSIPETLDQFVTLVESTADERHI